jgi:hypothetical protein
VLDPTPTLVNKDGTLKQDVSSAPDIITGTIKDGTSELIHAAAYNRPLNFSISETTKSI